MTIVDFFIKSCRTTGDVRSLNSRLQRCDLYKDSRTVWWS